MLTNPSLDLPVVLYDGDVTIADYPISHIRALLGAYGGEIAEVVARLECDGWTPAEVVAGVAR